MCCRHFHPVVLSWQRELWRVRNISQDSFLQENKNSSYRKKAKQHFRAMGHFTDCFRTFYNFEEAFQRTLVVTWYIMLKVILPEFWATVGGIAKHPRYLKLWSADSFWCICAHELWISHHSGRRIFRDMEVHTRSSEGFLGLLVH